MNAISGADRQIITAENVRREADHLNQLNIDQMATLLTQRSADRMSSQEVIFKASENTRPNITPQNDEKVDLVGPPAPPPPPQATRGRGQNRFRGGYHGYRGRGKGRGRFSNNGLYKRVTAEQAGVSEQSCLLCGDPNHKFRDEKCNILDKNLWHLNAKNVSKGHIRPPHA